MPACGRITPAPSCDLAKARSKLESSPITSPVDFISGPRIVSTSGKRAKGNTASFTATCGAIALVVEPEFGEPRAGHHPGADLRHRDPGRLGDEGHGAGGTRVHLQHVDRVVLDCVLHVHQPDDAERACAIASVSAFSSVTVAGDERVRRQGAGGIAGMDAGFLDMLHHAGDIDGLAVG